MGSGLCRPLSKKKEAKINEVVDQWTQYSQGEVPPPVPRSAREVHRLIERQLKQMSVEENRFVKLLLLGPADSGKSTIAKQMRILHAGGFSEAELIDYRYLVRANLITCYHHLAEGIHQLGILPHRGENGREQSVLLLDSFRRGHTKLVECDEEEQVRTLLAMGNCSSVHEAYKRINEIYYTPDNCKYLISHAPRISQTSYMPTKEDVIHARAATTGVHEIQFSFKRFNIRLIDVGGQKSERRKWIHCFDSVTAVLFISSLACYDQVMEEESEEKKNRMEDAVELFQQMHASAHLKRASFILFLNKKDIFAEKLAHSPLRKFFPAFSTSWGINGDYYERALDFIREQFLQCQKTGFHVDQGEDRRVYTHVTNATDRANISFMFGASCDLILQKSVNNSGMV